MARLEIFDISPKLQHFMKESSLAYEEPTLGVSPTLFSFDDHLYRPGLHLCCWAFDATGIGADADDVGLGGGSVYDLLCFV